MQITHQPTSNLTSEITIEVKKEDFEGKVKKSLNNIARQVQMKGFRPGMAPMHLVKQMYGDGIVAEEVNKLLNDEVMKYINEQQIDILAQPLPANDEKLDLGINKMADFTFRFEIGHSPEIDLSFLKTAPAFTRYKIRVEDAMIDEELMKMRKRFATYEYPEEVMDNDILSFTFEACNPDGSTIEGGHSAVNSIMPDFFKEEYRDRILSLRKQGSVVLNLFEAINRPRADVFKQVLNITEAEQQEGIGDWFKLTLNNITRSVPAEINEAFMEKVYGATGPRTEEEIRLSIRTDLDAFYEGRTDTLLVNELYKQLMENTNIPLPDQFLKRWIQLSQEKPVTMEEVEADYPGFSKALRWSLIQKKVARDNQLSVDPQEVDLRLRQNLVQQLYGYGLTNIGEDWVENFMNKQRKDEKAVSQAREQVLEDKVLHVLKSQVSFSEKLISLDEFKAMVESHNAQYAAAQE